MASILVLVTTSKPVKLSSSLISHLTRPCFLLVSSDARSALFLTDTQFSWSEHTNLGDLRDEGTRRICFITLDPVRLKNSQSSGINPRHLTSQCPRNFV
ncbi:hypothetical protein RRG08_030004 [Elysia crispata]|uniref:Uncharacterized protein n=1 Tax=Elysia crispata TaxID=231223 RepID=A0AAE0XY66_9GAST|nr:hypothetical protein RRG08_030004 [Elysia crispata]